MGKAAAVVALAVGATACMHATTSAQGKAQPSAQQPRAMEATVVSASATVKKIDRPSGVVTLKGREGRDFEVKAGPDVDLNRLHVGDKVTAMYYDAVAVGIDKASTGAPTMTSRAVVRGGVTARQATVTARIVSVHPSKNSVVIRGPGGGERTLKVEDPALQARLKQIKPGENFDVTYTQAVAVMIQPRK
jgi:Cu/Ag efflux protein CusF